MTQPIYLGKGYQDDDVVAEYYERQDITHKTLDKLSAMQKLYKFIYDTVKICSIDQKGVHLIPADFITLFETWETKQTSIEEYPMRYEAIYDNTLFFCLIAREDTNHDQ